MLQELEEMHSSQELAVMEMFHNVEKTIEKIEDGCKFTERILKNGNSLQMILMKKHITSQLLSLINNAPKPEVNINMEFHTDSHIFQEAIKCSFGSFQKEESQVLHYINSVACAGITILSPGNLFLCLQLGFY